jgi:predicted O-methyltransferase YrrM
MKEILSKIPYLRYAYWYRKNAAQRPGHYYSPVIDIDDLERREEQVWKKPRRLEGIVWNDEEQESFLSALIESNEVIPFTDNPSPGFRYYFDNKTYPHSDGLVLFSMLRAFKPKRIIEVGSGFSSALILDTRDHFLKDSPTLTFIEPNPDDRLTNLLKREDYETVSVVKDIVQNTPVDTFRQLRENDILLIDNSHVSKVGSDVNYLMTEILPCLNKGVIVHIHDIFYPFEYPKDWIFEHKLNWNEIYMVHNFLLFNSQFKIIFFSDYVHQKYKQRIENKVPLFYKGRPGSLWLQRV